MLSTAKMQVFLDWYYQCIPENCWRKSNLCVIETLSHVKLLKCPVEEEYICVLVYPASQKFQILLLYTLCVTLYNTQLLHQPLHIYKIYTLKH